MRDTIESELRSVLEFDRLTGLETIQSLWSGYGVLCRVWLAGGEAPSVIVKRITPPATQHHPRGWSTNLSHQRKLRSYEVEANWYGHYASRTGPNCRVPKMLGVCEIEGGSLLVLEDLDAAGFPLRKGDLDRDELNHCLSWLADFHARFLGAQPDGLWEQGTYWQLDTRPDEWKVMANGPLKSAAQSIHEALANSQFQTVVHGDAKYANFCFAESGAVAAVDFQYVGGGCGMKDVAYLLSCIAGGIRSDREEDAFLNHYFQSLRNSLKGLGAQVDPDAVEQEWRQLYPLAWADFERFLQGWAPGHWKLSGYSNRKVEEALELLG